MKYLILKHVIVTTEGGAFMAFRPLTEDNRVLYFDTKELAVGKLNTIFKDLPYDNSQYSVQEVYTA
jgi:hypothetical protein